MIKTYAHLFRLPQYSKQDSASAGPSRCLCLDRDHRPIRERTTTTCAGCRVFSDSDRNQTSKGCVRPLPAAVMAQFFEAVKRRVGGEMKDFLGNLNADLMGDESTALARSTLAAGTTGGGRGGGGAVLGAAGMRSLGRGNAGEKLVGQRQKWGFGWRLVDE